MITQGNYSVLIAYACPMSIPAFEIIFFALNFVFYAMEMKNTITGELVMQIGEFGPVELELIFSCLLWYLGIYGNDGMFKTVRQSYGSEIAPEFIADYKWTTIFGIVITIV